MKLKDRIRSTRTTASVELTRDELAILLNLAQSSNLTGTPANLEIALAALKRATSKLLSAYRSLPEPTPTPAAPPNGDKPDA